jgi:hypothetical protein
MNRRSFLKILGIGAGAVAVAPAMTYAPTYKGKVHQLCYQIASNKVHPLDGCLLLADLKDESNHRCGSSKEFADALKCCPNDYFDVVVDKCAYYVLGDDTAYGRLREARQRIPLRSRTTPNCSKYASKDYRTIKKYFGRA